MLPGGAAQSILDATHKLFQGYNFQLGRQETSVFIMDGVDEGKYAWVTVNYLLGRLGKPASETVGVFDLGGGSTQIAFAVDTLNGMSEKQEQVTKQMLHVSEFAGHSYTLYTHSYLGFGLNSARDAIMNTDKAKADPSGHPCLPVGYTHTIKEPMMVVKGAQNHNPNPNPYPNPNPNPNPNPKPNPNPSPLMIRHR